MGNEAGTHAAPVNVTLDFPQIVHHSLVREFMNERRHTVDASVEDQQD